MRQRAVLPLLIASVLLAEVTARTCAAADAPDWLQAQVAMPTPAHDEEAGAVQLYSEQILTVKGVGKFSVTTRVAYRVLRQGAGGRDVISIPFDPLDRVVDLRAWSIPTQGRVYEVKRKEAAERAIDAENGVLMSDVRELSLRIPAADPGNVIGFEVEQEEAPYFMGEDWDFQDSLPVREAHFRLRLPAGWRFASNWVNHSEVTPVHVAPNEWSWVLTDLPAIRREEDMPPWRGIAGHMFVTVAPPGAEESVARSWAGIGAWYDGLLRGRDGSTPEIQHKVVELTAGSGDTVAKLQALAHFVQKDIRYVGIELGIGGYQPHPSALTFANRYGDCKDKALLLATMLREIGVESYPVLINTRRGSVNESTPPTLAFDHVVLAIRLPPDVRDDAFTGAVEDPTLGRLLYFDPTNDKIPFGRIGGYLQANYGLLVTNVGGKLTKLPLTPASNGIARTGKLALDETGCLTGSFEESWIGDAAWRQREVIGAMTSDTDKIKPAEAMIAESMANYRLVRASIRNRQRTDAPFGWAYEIEAPAYAKASGDLLMVRPRVLGVLGSGLLETKRPRQNDIEFDAPSLDTDVFDITLPAGFDVDELPAPVNVDLGFAAYVSKTALDGRTLHYTRRFEVKDVSVPVAKAEQLRNLYRVIAGDERALAVLKKKGM